MPHALIVTLALAATTAAPPTGENLWLVAPLYPGQELLVSRTEGAIHKLLPPSSTDLVGDAALVSLLQAKKGDIGCATGDRACRSPVDDYLHSLGLAKIVLIKGGQEEPNYTFQVVTVDLATGDTHNASGSGPVLEKALLAALVKVAPLASSLSVVSDPPGADVTIDAEKVGKTPFDGQILPGDRTIKLDLVGYQEVIKTVTVGARGEVKINEKLSLAPSKVTIQVLPKDATVFLDQQSKGDGDQTLDVTPGSHLIEAKKAGYEDFSQTVSIEPNKTKVVLVEMQASIETNINNRSRYLIVDYDQSMLFPVGGAYHLNALAFDNLNSAGNPNLIAATPNGSQNTMRGGGVEYGAQWTHFGLEAVGLNYQQTSGTLFNVYPGKSTNNGGNPPYTFNQGQLVEQGFFRNFDLKAFQPQAHYVWWHFMFQAQAGLGLRVLWIQTPNFAEGTFTHHNGYLDLSPYVSAQANLRFYIADGWFLVGTIRDEIMLTGSIPEWGFNGGFGYAFP